ncbi:hypothetical protein KDY119_02191 [Luteimicrobium xylanilyticum]|uniref:Uncharacterized protein n=1 Tax=Luteimicrobium xylanilyticum TaxID=1133546 RepID=A0A5P9QC61_9MICO|nr:hypothetical protein [Luteimicrobium xylanilyticum]QFU98672.1 hypothetical protein KDY119_02191 [Luteimicrobium xylanilyticum]
MAAMGVREPRALTPAHLRRRVTTSDVRSYAEIFEWLSPGELLGDPPETWAADWAAASADRFGPVAAPVR